MRFIPLMIAVVLLAMPPVLEGQPGRVPRIGLLSPGSPSVATDAFRSGLAEQGYVEGRNIHLDFRWAEGRAERLPVLAAELVQAKVDVIVAFISSAAKAAQQATRTIPIVMVGVGDPVSLGLVASLARPGGNITGNTSLGPELNAKRMQLLKEILPGLKRAAVLWTPRNPLHESSVRRTEAAALAVGVKLQPLKVTSVDEIESAIRTASEQHADALIVLGDPLLSRTRIAPLALERRLPTTFPERAGAEAGGLISYGPNMVHVYKRAAVYVDRILKGMKPGDLPVEEPSTFELVINLKTAKALGLTIPPSILARADEIIQ